MFMAQRAEDQCGCHDGDGQPPEDMFVGNVSQWGVVKGQVKSVTTEHTLIRALAELVMPTPLTASHYHTLILL